MEGSALETALQCLIAVARHHGIDLSVDRIKHDYALQPGDDVTGLLPKIARGCGMQTRKLKVGWKELPRLGEAYPAIARLANGNSVILLGFHEDKVGLLDPLADRLAVLRLDQATFCKNWIGELLLLRRTFALADESRPFGFAWFIPEVVRNGGTFRDVAIAAVMLQVLALALPIFIQITVDKILVHQAYTTLYVLVETIHGMETVKGLATEPLRRRDWDARCGQAAESRFDVGRISTSAQAVIGLLEKLLTVAVIGFGAVLVFDGQMTVGALIAFNMLSGRVTTPLAQIVGLVQGYQEAGLSVRMLGQIMNRTPERPPNVRGLRPPIAGAVEFEHVIFRYSESAPPALDDVSLTIPAGSVFGIVGRSGSGKTTLTRLIRGMYPIQLGSVRVDGHDIRELDLPHLRSNVGVVMQQCFLFRGTVRENIAVTKPDASLEEIVHAATMAGADEFIKVLPQGYDTLLEEGGTNLSGGQQQRLSIARALLRQPRILILDEATSALDPESEAIVQANLARIAEGRSEE